MNEKFETLMSEIVDLFKKTVELHNNIIEAFKRIDTQQNIINEKIDLIAELLKKPIEVKR